MARFNAILTGACMGLVAGFLGVAAYFYFGMTRAESAGVTADIAASVATSP